MAQAADVEGGRRPGAVARQTGRLDERHDVRLERLRGRHPLNEACQQQREKGRATSVVERELDLHGLAGPDLDGSRRKGAGAHVRAGGPVRTPIVSDEQTLTLLGPHVSPFWGGRADQGPPRRGGPRTNGRRGDERHRTASDGPGRRGPADRLGVRDEGVRPRPEEALGRHGLPPLAGRRTADSWSRRESYLLDPAVCCSAVRAPARMFVSP